MHPIFSMRTERFFPVLIAVAILALPASLLAEGNSTSMGFVSTVVSDGAFDAVRNPALLGFQTSRHAVGVMAKSGPSSSMDVDVNQNGMQYNLVEEYYVQIGAVYAYKATSAVWAIAFSGMNDDDDEQYKTAETEMKAQVYNEDVSANMDVTLKQKEEKISPSLVFSAAFPLSGGAFFGFQGNIGMMTDNVKNHIDAAILLATPVNASSNFETQKKAYLFEAAAGFVQKLEHGQVGLLVRSGKLYSDSIDADFSSTYSPSQSSCITNPLRYISGMSIAAGVYWQLISTFGFTFESEYRFPVEYRLNTLEEEDGHIDEKPLMIANGRRFQFKSGVEWSGISNLLLSAGILLSFEKKEKFPLFHEENNNGPQTEFEELSIVALACGASYRLSNSYLFTFTAGYMKAKVDMEKMGSVNSMNAAYERIFFMAGVSMGF